MTVRSAPLAQVAAELRSGSRDVTEYVDDLYDHLDAMESDIQAFVPETASRSELLRRAERLAERYPDPTDRPPLYGVPIGVKDVVHADGFPTKAGARLPPEELDGQEASSVSLLRDAGALVVGKTVTTEFASVAPGPTRNPHDLRHTPGGSSSGSAAAVAAGVCPLAVGTQTAGSVIRPAAFCGVVGFKPTLGRVPTDGVVPFAESADHVGLFTQDVEGMSLAASTVCEDWGEPDVASDGQPVLGVPDGEYLDQVESSARDEFENEVRRLKDAGYTVARTTAFSDFQSVNRRHRALIYAEKALTHAEWFAEHGDLYRSDTAQRIHRGRETTIEQLVEGRLSQDRVRAEVEEAMESEGIDVWITPSAPGPAPRGIKDTGSAVMNIPWTHAGLPAVTVPAGKSADGLPLGVQCVAQSTADESLLTWAECIDAEFPDIAAP